MNKSHKKLIKKTLLVNFLKVTGFKLFIASKIFDALWVVVVAPFLKAHKASEKMKEHEKATKELGRKIKYIKDEKDFKKAVGHFWENKKSKKQKRS